MRGIRRGLLRFYVLRLLMDSEKKGYGLIKKVEEETGFWRPSPGSVYPLLESLKEEGLINCEELNKGKIWKITEQGKKYYNGAHKEKESLFKSMKRSMIVFSKVFGEEGVHQVARQVAQWRNKRESFSEIKEKAMGLQEKLCRLPQLSDGQREKVASILSNALREIEDLDLQPPDSRDGEEPNEGHN